MAVPDARPASEAAPTPSILHLFALGLFYGWRSMALNLASLIAPPSPRLVGAFALLVLAYPFGGAYRLRYRYRDGRLGATLEELTYGETLLPGACRILAALGARRGQRLLDLGAGRGVMTLVGALRFGLRVRAVELVPEFVRRGRLIARLAGARGVEWVEADLAAIDLGQADLVYLAGTCLGDERLQRLAESVARLPQGARVASVSAPLESPWLETVGALELPFTWGNSVVYLQRRR